MSHEWDGFTAGEWQNSVDVRDFIQKNYTPYDGDSEFLAGPTEKTLKVWGTLEDEFLSVERQRRVYDVDTETPAGITAFGPGYISDDDDVVVGLQTDVPLKRAMMPNGGWRMVETAIKEAGKEPSEEIKEIFTKYRKTHNQGVFDAYTSRVRAARSSHIITGLPDAYGRGRIVPEVTRVALYGIDRLIEEKEADKQALEGQTFTPEWAQLREEVSEQIKALKEIKQLGAIYGFDISAPASNAQEALQWTYFGYLAAIKSQDGAAMSIGRLSPFFDIFIKRDLDMGLITEEDAQELIDQFVLKLRIVRFLRTIDYDQIFSGDPYWATWTDAGFGEDGRHQVTKTSFRLLQTLVNLGPAPEPNITILWDEKLPEAYRNFCSRVSIDTSSIQYENDATIRAFWGDNAVIACCVSPVPYGKGVQHFGARANMAKTFLYGINGGRDEISGKQIIPEGIVTPISGDGPLQYDEVWEHFDAAMTWVAETYVEALNIIHYMHDKYSYEAAEFALLDTHLIRVLGCGIAGLSVVTDSLAAVKYAQVYPIRDESGLVTTYRVEGEAPLYGNDDDRADDIAQQVVKTFMDKIRSLPTYRDAKPTQSVLTITSNVVYGKTTGDMPVSHKLGEPFAPGANPSNGADTHGVLASMMSLSKIDYSDALDGISLTSSIVPSGLGATKDEQTSGLTKILDRAFSEGLYHTNINVLNRETLEDAMLYPEKYPNLTVRVSGYAVNFVRLTEDQQKDVISRTFHAM